MIALPDQMFYNTGIYTYIWIVSNKKSEQRKGKVQLIDATAHYQKMRKSLGNKRHELSSDHITELTGYMRISKTVKPQAWLIRLAEPKV